MKKAIILLLIIINTIQLNAFQLGSEVILHESESRKLDSILAIAATYEKKTESLDYLLNQTWSNRNIMPALSYHLGNEAIKLAELMDDNYNLVKAYSFKGVACRLLGDYNQALDIYYTGLRLSKEYNIREQEGYAHINIANLYIYMEFYSQAYENLKYALVIAEEINDLSMLSYVHLYKGRVLINMDSLDNALEHITQSLELRKKTGNLPGQADCYKYIGDIYFSKNELQLAKSNYDLALETLQDQTDRHLIGNIYLQKARISHQQNDLENAYSMAEQALATGEELDSKLLIHDAIGLMAEIDLMNKDFEKAAQNLTLKMSLADSLLNQKLSEKVIQIEFRLENERQEAFLSVIRKDKEIQSLKFSRQRFVNYALSAFSFILIIGGIILYTLLRKLKEKNKLLIVQRNELKQLNIAKDKMFMVIGHDLRGPIWNLRALIELMRDEHSVENNPEAQENFRALSSAVQAVSDLLENLLYWAKAQDGKITFNPVNADLLQLTKTSMQPYQSWALSKGITVDIICETSSLNVMVDVNMMQAILRNLISNAIKYSPRNGLVEIRIKDVESRIRFSIQDNGVGISAENIQKIQSGVGGVRSSSGTENETGSGIGLNLSRDFAHRNNTEIIMQSKLGEGTVFYFDLPLESKNKNAPVPVG